MYYLIRLRQDYAFTRQGDRFIIVDKQTDHEKASEQIERSSFSKIDYDPTTLHIDKVKEWATKWISSNEIGKKWAKCIVNENAIYQEKTVHCIKHINQITYTSFNN